MRTIFLRNKTDLAFFLLLAPVSSCLSILFALSLEPIVTAAIEKNGSMLWEAVCWCALMALFDAVFEVFRQKQKIRLVNKCESSLRDMLSQGMADRSIFEFQKRDSSWYLSLFHNDTQRMKDTYFAGVCNLYQSVWSLLLSILAIGMMNLWITIFLLVIGIISICLPKLFEGRLLSSQETQSKAADRHMSVLKDFLNGFWIIKEHHIEKKQLETYQDVNRQLTGANVANQYLPYWIGWISANITTAAFVGVLALSAVFSIQGKIEVGMLLSLSQLIGGILVPFESIPTYLSGIKGCKEIKSKMADCLPREGTNIRLLENKKWERIEFQGIQFAYEGAGEEKNILQNLNFVIERGKKYVILGKSGSGKSTLAKILVGIYPAGYELLIDGRPCDPQILQEKCSYQEQNVFLFQDTVWNNVTLYKNMREEEVKEVLRALNFSEEYMETKDFLQMNVGENGSSVSGGERQRLGLARELLDRKEILILDEFTANLDPKTAEQIESVVMGLKDTTCIMITHRQDSEMVRRCDAVWEIGDVV